MTAFRYISRAMLARTAVALGAGMVLYLAIDLVEWSKAFAHLEIPWSRALWWSLLTAPRAAVRLLPVAALLGAFLTVAALRRRGEIEALTVLGRGPGLLAIALGAGGLVCGIAAFALGELVVPAAMSTLEEGRIEAGWYGPPADGIWTLDDGVVWRASGIAPGGEAMSRLSGVRTGRFDGPLERWDLVGLHRRDGAWYFTGGEYRRLAPTYEIEHLGPGIAPIGTSVMLGPAPREADALAFGGLAEVTRALREAGRPSPRLEVELWGRLALTLIAIVAPLCALPFAPGGRRAPARWESHRRRRSQRPRRADTAAALGAALAAAFPLWILVASGRALGMAGVVPAPAAAAVPVMLVALAVALLSRRAWRPR